jgi:pimeloyl-ACP methyl ester carboxylesterase
MAGPYPIVFFPGVMGSRLYFEVPKKLWDPDSTWQMLLWLPQWPFRSDDDNRRQLHFDQPAYVVIDPAAAAVPPEMVEYGWGGVPWGYYGAYLLKLRALAAGGKAFVVGYDWRQDIRGLGELAADKLNACLGATNADKLWVVGHSMGALVVRAAFRHDPTLVGRVDKFLMVCPPNAGAVVLYRRLFTGMVSGLDGGLSDLGYRLVLGNSQAAFVGNMSGLPGAMQLLPSESFPRDDQEHSWNDALDNGTAFADLYDNAACPPGIDDTRLTLPADARADLDERLLDLAAYLTNPVPPDPAPPASWLIYGTGVKTEVRITAAAGPAEPGLTLHGDGTVPSLSAVTFPVPAEQQFAVDGLDHGKACLHPQVIAQTADILQ